MSAPLRVVMLDAVSPEEFALAAELLPANRFTYESNESPVNADVIVTKSKPVGRDLIAANPNLKLIQKYGGRPDRLDTQAARDAGVLVAVMPLRGCIAVAEMTMTLLLALSKQLVEAHHLTATGAYRDLGIEPKASSQRVHAFQWMKLQKLQEITGKTLGLVGFGEIGTEVARRANAFGMKVIYFKREPLSAEIESLLNVTSASLDEVLATSDFVSLHVPHSDATNKLIGAREFGLMKPSAYLINTCRGPVTDEEALIAALRNHTIAGAGLDVFDFEPLQFDNPLTTLDNVILAPHIGGGTGGAREKQLTDVLSNVVRFADGEPLLHKIG